MAENPYAAPRAHVQDAGTALAGEFVAEGRSVPGGHGWDWIRDGFAMFRQQPGTWILIVIVFVVIAIAMSVIPIVGSLALQLLAPVFTGGIMLGCRQMEEGGEISVGSLFAGFSNNGGRLILLGLSSLLAIVVIVLVTGTVFGVGGAALLGATTGRDPTTIGFATILLAVLVILALSLPVYMALWFSPALIALDDLPLGAALKASFSGCLRNFIPFLLYGVVLFVFLILAMIPAGLGMLVMLPVLFASVYTAYRDIYYVR